MGGFPERILPSLASDGVSVMLLALAAQFIQAGKAHEEQHSALHASQQRSKLLRPPWALQTRRTFSIPPIAVSLGTALSLCKELFPQ